MGFPTIFDLPMIIPFFPDRSGLSFLSSIEQPRGVQGTREFKPDQSFPTFSA